MKILSVTHDIDSGGAAKSLFLLARQIVAEGHELRIFSICRPSRTQTKVDELRALGVEIHFFDVPYFPVELHVCPIPFWRNAYKTLKRVGEYRRLAREAGGFAPDVVHYNSYTTLFVAQWLRRYPNMLHARETLIESSPRLPVVKGMVQRSINEIIAISPEEGEQAQRLFSIPVTTVFNWPQQPPELIPMAEEGPLVYGVFSHITPAKGHLECVRACALAADTLRQANVRIRLFGGKVSVHEGYYQQIVKEISDSQIQDIVEFPGFSDTPELEMCRAHLIVRPDATGQPWGRDVIEAMSLGRPVLAVGERETFVRTGVTGTLVPRGDVRALAEAMVELADRATLKRLGEGAFRFAAQHFHTAENPRRIIARMQNLLTAKAASRRR